jgi:hypothetical protein
VAGEIPTVEIKIVSGRLGEGGRESGPENLIRDEILRHIANGWTLPNGFPIDTPIYEFVSHQDKHMLYIIMQRQSCGVKIVKQDIKIVYGEMKLNSPEPFIKQINDSIRDGWIRYKGIIMGWKKYKDRIMAPHMVRYDTNLACQIMTKPI